MKCVHNLRRKAIKWLTILGLYCPDTCSTPVKGKLKTCSIMSVLQASKCASRTSERQKECVGSQTDKTGQREFLFACQSLSLMFEETKKIQKDFTALANGCALLHTVGPTPQGTVPVDKHTLHSHTTPDLFFFFSLRLRFCCTKPIAVWVAGHLLWLKL